MKKNFLLGSTILLAGVLSGCSKTEELILDEITENLKEDLISDELTEIIEEEDNLSANLNLARSEYIENEKPLYINDLLVVNKEFGISKDFAKGLAQEVQNAFNKMKEDAEKEGIIINIRSGYRSYETQKMLYDNYVARDGLEKASRYSAKPGHSEHQTGLAIDITTEDTTTSIGDWFNNTKQAEWLYNNAYKYGFILRYPQNKEHITGYKFESWHYRYVGLEHSKHFAMNDLTLEEYLKIVSN